MIPPELRPLANHLWQSTLFVAVVALLTLALRKNRAAVRYWLWLAASMKFLVPFSLLIEAGSRIQWQSHPVISHLQFSFAMDQIARPFVMPAPVSLKMAAPSALPVLPAILCCLWFCGFAFAAVSWIRSWRRIRAVRCAASPLDLKLPIPVFSTSDQMEPGVFGIRKPVLLLPAGIMDRLTPAQLEAVLAHELCHVRRRDNLTAAVHTLVETIFWFHPLVWWIRARLVEEREHACDEAAVESGGDTQAYAEGILNVCRLYLESPLACVSGVAGSNLRRRIASIVNCHISRDLNFWRKLLLGVAAFAVVAGPIAVGITTPPPGLAQSEAGEQATAFEVASVKFSDNQQSVQGFTGVPPPIPRGHQAIITYTHVTLQGVIQRAYGVVPSDIVGPSWMREKFYDIVAKVPQGASGAQIPARLQTLLADRFRMRVHWQTREEAGYALVVGKTRLKLNKSVPGSDGMIHRRVSFTMGGPETHFEHKGETLAGFASSLRFLLARPVADATGIDGEYDFSFDCATDSLAGLRSIASSDHSTPAPSIFTAIRELGLNLVSRKVPVKQIVVDSVEAIPTEN
jgi:bla regulator protein blaR1